MPKPVALVTVSRKWNNPRIEIVVNNVEINLSISMEDFVQALLEEFGNPALVVTRGQFSSRLRQSVERVIAGVKEESVKGVA